MIQTADLFQSGMVIQRSKPFWIWGTADAGSQITIEMDGNKCTVNADDKGYWNAELPAMEAAENIELRIYNENDAVSYSDIAVGEVWIAGGQSNMEFHMRYEKHLALEKPICSNSRIRFYDVPEVAYEGQEKDFDYSRMGFWRKATAADIEYFSGVGYYFEKELEQHLDVPVGIIGCNWGGTSASSWMSRTRLEQTGKPWMDDFEIKTTDLDLDTYRAEQKKRSMNARGNPFADVMTEFLLSGTPSPEEIKNFINHLDVQEEVSDALPPQAFPGSLYEHMVKSIAPYRIRGIIWYQGESDDALGCQYLYENMLRGLIEDWRILWNDHTLPFLVVQLPGWEGWMGAEGKGFPMLRHCQEVVANQDDHVHVWSITDAGEQYEIHPKNKKRVGRRLALLALGHVYQQAVLCDAPAIESVHRDADLISISFKHAEGGLRVEGTEIAALEVFSDNAAIPFKAEVSGENLLIRPLKESRKAIQISFAQNQYYQVNLYNQNGIPAIPFQLEVPYK